jgi:hypothetical protein
MKELIEFLKTRFARHYDCEDGYYSCPKVDDYWGPHAYCGCDCGKEYADDLIKKYESESCRASDPVIQRLLQSLREANIQDPEYTEIKRLLEEGVDGRYKETND